MLTKLIDYVTGFYAAKDGITMLTNSNFDDLVMNSRDVWVVEFYSPTCRYCKALVNEIKKLGAMQKAFQVGAINGPRNRELVERYDIRGYPTIMIFARNKKIPPLEHEGVNTAAGIKASVLYGRFD